MDSSREILHQIKNHLAVYSSLLRLTRSTLEKSEEQLLLDKMEALFSVFAQVYQRLHHEQLPSEEGAAGSLKAAPYLRDMVEAFRLSPWNIPLESRIELSGQTIQSRDAVPLGLLLTQTLISLAGDHHEPDKIRLIIRPEAGQWRLILDGDRPAFSEDTELMVSALAGQLGGRVETQDPAKPEWTVLFPLSLFTL
jgi:two-component sensor histidine kinase